MSFDYITYAVFAVGIFTVYMALVHIFKPDRRKDQLKARMGAAYPSELDDNTPPLAVFCASVLSLLRIKNEPNPELTSSFMQAGISSPHAVTYFYFFQRVIQPILLVLGVLFLLKLIDMQDAAFAKKAQVGLVAVLLLIAGFSGVQLYIKNARQRRQKILLRSFPEVMDLLLVCIESGLGLDASLARVGNEMKNLHPVAAYEIDRTRLELNLLSDRSLALENLAERTQIIPYKALVSALVQTEKFGTSLVDTLRVLSDDLRTTRLLNAENRAARIPVFITIPLIFCILPAFIIIILGPPVVKVINQGGIFGTVAPPPPPKN
jgi:tight adherence protein C